MLQPFTPFTTPNTSLTSSNGYCNICYMGYNLNANKPLIICPQGHCICKSCLKAIRSRLRCPFCRSNINLDDVKINKNSLQYIYQIQKNKERKWQNLGGDQRLPTLSEYEDEIFQPEQLQQNLLIPNGTRRQENTLKILLFVQLIVLQLPTGLFSLFLGLSQPQSVCLDQNLVDSSVSLRASLLLFGYLQFLISALSIYFSACHYCGIMQTSAAHGFCIFLVCFSLLKCLMQAFVSIKFLASSHYESCSHGIFIDGLINSILNQIGILLPLIMIIYFIESMI